MNKWQQIDKENPPKGELVLLAWGDGCIRIGERWADIEQAFKSCCDFGDFTSTVYAPKDYQPTHWMQLPTPPETNK